MPTVRQLKKASKAIKDRRIEIDGRVWYIPLPGRPQHSHGPKTGLRHGKRRAKAKARTNRKLALVVCKRSDPLYREPRKLDLWWLPSFIEVRKREFQLELFQGFGGETVVQPRFRHIPQLSNMACSIDFPITPFFTQDPQQAESRITRLRELVEAKPFGIAEAADFIESRKEDDPQLCLPL